MLALRAEPELRWRSVDALADDVRRHLEGQPVEAQRGWRGYRVRNLSGSYRTWKTAMNGK